MALMKKTVTFLCSSALVAGMCCGVSFASEKDSDAAATAAEKVTEEVKAKGESIIELLDINTATTEMLAKVPVIGEQLGKAIVAFRDTNGPFAQVADLLKVDGIDTDLLEKIKPFIKV